MHRRDKLCPGNSSSCSGSSYGAWKPWTVADSCLPNERCAVGDSTCNSYGTCGNGACEACEDPNNCSADCGLFPQHLTPTTYYQNSLASPTLTCSSTASTTWHHGTSGGLPDWVFASNCGVPPTSSPSSYTGYNARYSFVIKKTGMYKIDAWFPDQTNACNFANDRFSPEIHYILNRYNEANLRVDTDQRNHTGSTMILFGSIHLYAGPHILYLYDDASGGCACNGVGCSTTNVRVFADSVYVEFISE